MFYYGIYPYITCSVIKNYNLLIGSTYLIILSSLSYIISNHVYFPWISDWF